jgi:hypothetical protein
VSRASGFLAFFFMPEMCRPHANVTGVPIVTPARLQRAPR